MSAQMALMAGTTALNAFSSIAAGNAQAGGYEAAAGGAMVQGAEYELQGAQVRLQAQQEELQRRRGLARLLSANRAAQAMSGISGEQGSSFDVIQDYDKASADEDIGNIRFMGESRSRMLSFAKMNADRQYAQYMSMAGMSRTQGILGAVRTIGMAGLATFGFPKFDLGGGPSGSGAAP
jgi:hypothetical protein